MFSSATTPVEPKKYVNLCSVVLVHCGVRVPWVGAVMLQLLGWHTATGAGAGYSSTSPFEGFDGELEWRMIQGLAGESTPLG